MNANKQNNLQIDTLDRKILEILTKNAKTSFLEVARHCNVSGAAIHQRIQKLEKSGIISGSQYRIDAEKLGFNTCAFVGIQVNLTSSSTHDEVFETISQIKEVTECHHITGRYSLLVKVYAQSNKHLKQILVEDIQSIVEVTSTETFLSLEEGFSRQVPLE